MRAVKSLFHAGWIVVVMAALLLGLPKQAEAQGGFSVSDIQVSYRFGEQITFQARIQSPAAISQASILFRETNESVTRVEPLTLAPDGGINFQYNASQNLLPPFSTVVFWFQVTFADGTTATSPVYDFRYDDNRFPWRQSSQGPITVHWYQGDDAFGQAALDSANASLGTLSQLVPVDMSSPLDVYIYANADDLQGTLYLGGKEWVGGHADPKLGVAMVAIAPGPSQGIEMDTEVPHELTHVMLYRSLGEGYSRLPTWLNEGLASVAERYPDPDYKTALQTASTNNSLLPMSSLCAPFPPDAGRAYLAYAEADSFVRYLRETYSTTGLSALVKAYADGLDCELGATRALGMPLTQLDTRWRESKLGQNVFMVALRNMAPYLLMLGMALAIPLWGLVNMFRERKQDERYQTE
jgi:hypothetical protein